MSHTSEVTFLLHRNSVSLISVITLFSFVFLSFFEKETLSTVEQLREISRQRYLEKREEKVLKMTEEGAYFSLLGINMIQFCI
jgi:hypothetical protein